MEKHLIGIVGKKSSGKDTIANVLVQYHGDAQTCRISLAGSIKDFAERLYGWDYETLYGESALREVPDPHRKRPDGTACIPRDFLKELGDCCRQFYQDSFIDYVMRLAAGLPFVVVIVPDVRYVNEAKKIKEAGGTVWRVRRPCMESADSHSSEQHQFSLEMSKYVDLDILNDGTLEDLERSVVAAFKGQGACASAE